MKKAGRKVRKRCATHNENRHEQIPLVSRRHQAQKTGSPVLIGFQNVRSLKNKMKDVLELIEDHKINVMFMAETWHDPESISVSKLWSLGLGILEKARPRLPESVNTLLSNHRGVAVAFNSTFQIMPLKLTLTTSENKLKLQVSHWTGCLSHK